jgi:hypothetical protein
LRFLGAAAFALGLALALGTAFLLAADLEAGLLAVFLVEETGAV